MYVDVVPNRNSPPAILLRKSRREGKRVIKKTLANLSHWPMRHVTALKTEPLVNPDDLFACRRSLPHGHVEVVLKMVHKIGLPQIIDRTASPVHSRVLALVIQRLLEPASKLASMRLWHDTKLDDELAVADSDCDELYAAMGWLIARQTAIERTGPTDLLPPLCGRTRVRHGGGRGHDEHRKRHCDARPPAVAVWAG